jgi:hypothetical protein
VVKIRATPENTVCTVSNNVRDNGHDPSSSQPPRDQSVSSTAIDPGGTAADDAYGADAKAALRFG